MYTKFSSENFQYIEQILFHLTLVKTQTHNNKICVNFIENPHLGGEMRANFWTSAAALELFPTATPFGSISQINFGSIVVFYDAGGIFRFLNKYTHDTR